MIKFICDKNKKLSKAVGDLDCGIPYSALQKLIRNKDIKINGKRINSDVTLQTGDQVEIYYLPKKQESFSVVYSDDNILVVDKKSGFTSESVFESVASEYNGARFIHRLDRNTSGIMVFAKNDVSESELLAGFKNHSFAKYYIAEVVGKMPKKEDLLTAYLLKDEKAATVKVFDSPVKSSTPIKTGYTVIEEKENSSVLRVRLYTGKTHQIRAHLAHVGHPIVGDGKYGNNQTNKTFGAKTQRLDAAELTLYFDNKSPLFYLSGKTFKKD